jgi:nucleotide-binding universal stress UspA family protein
VPPGQAADIFVAYGEPARELVSLQSARGIKLTVIGKRDASLMRDVLQRSKGQRVLNQSAGDVLVSTLHHATTTG